jgi:hypothetical protein
MIASLCGMKCGKEGCELEAQKGRKFCTMRHSPFGLLGLPIETIKAMRQVPKGNQKEQEPQPITELEWKAMRRS